MDNRALYYDNYTLKKGSKQYRERKINNMMNIIAYKYNIT